MPALRVIKSGMLTTVQDLGRWGYQARGVPVAGPMDPLSHRIANALVGNSRDAATLEVTLLGPELEFEDERMVAIAGARFDVTVDGKATPAPGAFVVSAGARLRFEARQRGARSYVAISGGVAVRPILGSRSTHVISALGGFHGRPLRGGDQLPLGDPARLRRTVAPPDEPVVELPERRARLRVLPGPQVDHFVTTALDDLQSSPYVVEQNSDRMGFRLRGHALMHKRSADIISDATPLGALQVPASGQPILLMADRQTSGGYPKIATLISADVPIAGQLGPGDEIVFEVCSMRDALAALIAQERAMLRLEEADRA